MNSTLMSAGCTLALLLVSPTPSAQLADLQPGRNFTAELTFGVNRSENIDVGDVDLDGDLDAILANGSDFGLEPERIFINDGTGAFNDETDMRLVDAVLDSSRDVEFVDIDNDGDLDVFVANHGGGASSTGGQVSRFYVNQGGLQGGAVGYFEDGTDERWGTLVAVPLTQQVYGGDQGPFRDWSCSCDFGDLDDDGDQDLFFGSYGPAINGTRESRVFLDDGVGVFNELWPWANAGADVSTNLSDVDLADFDGDFDLDVFVSSRNSQARVYLNNLYGAQSGSPFQDITQAALIAQGATLSGATNYEVEYADVDGDNDFDCWLVNYSMNLDRMLRNDGPSGGVFRFTRMDSWIMNDPNELELEVDFGDYDSDGDLDALTASFNGGSYLYQSGLAQGSLPGSLYHRTGFASGQSPNAELPSSLNTGKIMDCEWADVDGDDDLDILTALDNNNQNRLFRNLLGVPDTHAPAFAQVTTQADKANGSDTVIHARAQDNAPFYLHDFYTAVLVYSVDASSPQSVPMFAQGGQQYRGVIPAQTDTTVEYHVEVIDLAGNTGVSATFSFDQGAAAPWTDLGFGLAGMSGVPSLVGTGPLTAGSAGTLALGNAAPSALCALFISAAGTSTPFKCGTLVPVPVALQLMLVTNGVGALPLAWASWPSGLSGASLHFQYAIADGAAVCGTSLSNALRADVP